MIDIIFFSIKHINICSKYTNMSKIAYLRIDDSQTIKSIQAEFNRIYPFLKIEFFRESHLKGEGNEKKKMYFLENIKLNKIQTKKKTGKISIEENKSVADLETEFQNIFGLYVQVFRKSGKVWIETSVTDKWPLNEQNEEGKRFSEKLKIEKEDPNDHDMY